MILWRSFVGPQGGELKIEDSGFNVASFTGFYSSELVMLKKPQAFTRKVDEASCDAQL